MKYLTLFFLIFLTNCSGTQDFTISGENYKYKVPKKYLHTEFSSLFGGQFSGDKAVSPLSLRFTIKTEPTSVVNEVSMLIYFDKKYSVESLYVFARKMIAGSSKAEINREHQNQYIYTDRLGSSKITYVSSFPPFSKSIGHDVDNADYFAEIMLGQPYSIAGKTVTPKGSCKVFMSIDSISLQFGGVGSLCHLEQLEAVSSTIRELFLSWRVS